MVHTGLTIQMRMIAVSFIQFEKLMELLLLGRNK